MVTVSFSCKAEQYKQILDIKEREEMKRMGKEISLSEVVNYVLKLGLVYRTKLDHEAATQGTKQAALTDKREVII